MRAVPRLINRTRAVQAPEVANKRPSYRGGVKLKEISIFARQFSTLILGPAKRIGKAAV